jgi:hypothetical protein
VACFNWTIPVRLDCEYGPSDFMRSGWLRLTGTDSLNESIQATGSRSNGRRREGEEISPARVPAMNFRGGRLGVGRRRRSGGFCR